MFVDTVRTCIDAYAMVPAAASILVAVSGGADSMALLSVLAGLRPVYGATLIVAHVHHQLRGKEADRDARFVAQHAARLGLPFRGIDVDVTRLQHTAGLSRQHAARHVRYEALSRLQQSLGATRIALGHMADDQAETLLIRLLRGSGPAGLAGIPPVRLPYIRPLMTVHRQAILAYLKAEGIPWVEDSSNTHRVYMRNRIRLDILPVLRECNPQVDVRLNELADMVAAEQRVLEPQVDALYQQVVRHGPHGQLRVACQPYRTAPLALQRQLLRRVIDRFLPPAVTVSFQQSERLRHLITHGLLGQRLTLPGHWMAERHRDTTLLWPTLHGPNTTACFTLPIPGRLEIPEFDIQLSAEIMRHVPEHIDWHSNFAYIDLACVQRPLQVRFRWPGDRFHPLGAPGSKKLKTFLIDKKVPRAERDFVPLVVSGTEIAWVVGYQLADPFKVCSDTQDVARLHYTTRRAHSL